MIHGSYGGLDHLIQLGIMIVNPNTETDLTWGAFLNQGKNFTSLQMGFSSTQVWLCLAWPLPTLFFWLAEYFARRRRVTAEGSEGTDGVLSEPLLSPMRPTTRELIQPGSCRVMCASLEHSIPHLRCKAQAGGLGKVMDLVARHSPNRHPDDTSEGERT